ncbi:glycosyl hydrolase [Pedobacter sp. AW31-3R]|uniref:glycosyl hydrolase n=1 Tax=Pedobacter sp. AW31-3R TaxID=3445781 RepID=UPI003FA091FF
MYKKRGFAAILVFMLMSIAAAGQLTAHKTNDWPAIEKQMKPWSRWWWMGSAVDEKNLAQLLQQYKAAGLGGMEITPIYGAVGYEQQYVPFLSPRWVDLLKFTVKKADDLQLGIDMNTGTGWPFGGPQVSTEIAASKLITQQYRLKAGERLREPVKVSGGKQDDAVLQALTAYGNKGEVLALLSFIQADGTLNWSPAKGSWELYAVFSGKTRQMVKRAAPGGEGFSLDHLDKNAVNLYLKRFDEAFDYKSQGVRTFFNDSYEVFGATWTPAFLAEFKKNRGYDLSMHIRELVQKDSTLNGSDAVDKVARLKSDYRETMDEMLLNNFTQNWTEWAHRYQAGTRNQSHGSPGNLLDLYGAVDIPETETFGSSYFPIPGLRRDSADVRNVDPDPVMSKFASSAAHTAGKTLVSSETFTWLTEHFKTSFAQCKPEAEKLFLSGINHIFYHGTTYSPSTATWPGWLFYASVESNPANSLWPHINGINTYITRCQSILQAGQPDNELLIYWPVYEVWNNAKGLDRAFKMHDIDDWLYPSEFYRISEQLSAAGYAFDFASDRLLKKTKVNNNLLQTAVKGNPYQILVIPACRIMPVETMENILGLAQEGATVIFQKLPEDVPGLNELKKRRAQLKSVLEKLTFVQVGSRIKSCKTGSGMILLAEDLQQGLAYSKTYPEALRESGLQFLRRKIDNGSYYYLVNHTAHTIDQYIPLNAKGKVLILDPQSGATGIAALEDKGDRLKVRVQLKSGEALVLKVGTGDIAESKPWVYLNRAGLDIKLAQRWSLHFTSGGPELPEDQQLDELVSWTGLGGEKLKSFSGAGEYTGNFNMEVKDAKEYVLNLTKVNESARIWINGQEAGMVWSLPFQLRIGKYLKKGNNTIKIEVLNLMANRIRDMDRKRISWKNYHEINFVNINYKSFDASEWTVMPSGLTGPVTITPYFE